MITLLSIIIFLLCLMLTCLGIWAWRRHVLLREFYSAVNAISGNFSLWDSNDRLILFNSVFRRDTDEIAGLVTPGLKFEDYIRARVEHGLSTEAIGQEEAWIKQRLSQHKNALKPFEIKLRHEVWHLLDERRTEGGGVVTHGIDISDRKRSQDALAESEQRFRDFAASGADWFWETDAQHRFSFISENVEEQTGVGASSLIGKRRDETAVVDKAWSAWDNHLAMLDRHERFRDFTFVRAIAEGRELWTTISGVPHFTGSGAFSGYRGIGKDVTELVEARHALELSEAKSQEFAKAQSEARIAADSASQAKSNFLASMSHEFRTPLNAILGFGQIMQLDRSENLNREYQEYVRIIVSSGRHLLNLVNEILDFASIEAGNLNLSIKPVDVKATVRDVVKMMQPIAAKADVTLEPIDHRPTPNVIADPQRVRQVLLNLISNAIKYNRPNGSVTVAFCASDAKMRITVSDTGIGIAEEFQSQVFTPFNRLGVEGMGLGLSLCQRLILAMDGEIGFESEPNVSSQFWIEIPLADAESPSLLEAPSALQRP